MLRTQNEVYRKFREYLKDTEQTFSYERKIILDAVLKNPEEFTAVSIMSALEESPDRVAKATVYRTIKMLLDGAIIREKYHENQRTVYECSLRSGHNIHVIPENGGVRSQFSDKRLDDLIGKICREKNITPDFFNVIIRVKNEKKR